MTKASPARRAKTIAKKPATKAKVETSRVEGHVLPVISTDVPVDKLAMVAKTLQRNLQSIPMTHWLEPINAALKSAYLVGKADAEQEGAGEDRALENGQNRNETALERGHDFLASMALHLGTVAQETGISVADLKFRWMAVNTTDGKQVLALFPTMPIAYANALMKF